MQVDIILLRSDVAPAEATYQQLYEGRPVKQTRRPSADYVLTDYRNRIGHDCVSHVMSKLDVLPLAVGKQIEVFERVIGVTMCLEVSGSGRRKGHSTKAGTEN